MSLATATAEMVNSTFGHCPSTSEGGILLLGVIMTIEMIVGLPVNMVALWIFCLRMKVRKPHTLFLFNLLLADFLLLISLPFRMSTNLREVNWTFGPAWCRINLFMLAVNRSASIAFMTVVALDRYFKVVHPHHCINRVTLAQAGWLAVLMWIVVIALRIPLLMSDLLHRHGNVSLCRTFDSYREIPATVKVQYVAFSAEFFLPWFLLLFCSGRIACHLSKQTRQKRVRRAVQAVGVISLVFTICFLPSIFTGLGAMYIQRFHPKNCRIYTAFIHLFQLSMGFTYLNSALDPLIYAYASSTFRHALSSLICKRGLVRKKGREGNHTTEG